MIGTVDEEQLDVLFRLLRAKLPPVLQALEQGGNGWRQILVLASYLLAVTVHRHPEYAASAMELLASFDSVYSKVEAEFARLNPGLVSQLVKDDVAFFVIPQDADQNKTQ